MIEKEKIEELMRTSPPVEPADDFTARTLERITSLEPQRIKWRDYLQMPFSLNDLRGVFAWTGHTIKDCAWSFFAAAFFYLVLSLVIFIGLQGNLIYLKDTRWIENQNILFVFAGLWLGILGTVLYWKGLRVVGAVRMGVIVYILVFAVGAIMMKPALPRQTAVFFAVVFATTSVVIAYYLIDTIERHEKKSLEEGNQSCTPY